MARTQPKTNWAPESIPTADDFNYIEGKLVELDGRVTPINKGGTGANTVSAAKTNLVTQGDGVKCYK